MKLKITNFKAIRESFEVDLNGINIIAGQNSGGKSSLIQAILFLKQNMDDKQDSDSLKFNQPLLSLGRFNDVVSRSVNNGALKFSFIIDIQEINKSRLFNLYFGRRSKERELYERINHVEYSVSFESVKQKDGHNIYIKEASLNVIFKDDSNSKLSFQRINRSGNKYNIEIENQNVNETTNADIFEIRNNNKNSSKLTISVGDILLRNQSRFRFRSNTQSVQSPLLDFVRQIIEEKFGNIHYIGPLRESPKNYYYFEDGGSNQVGINGEFTPQFLAKNRDRSSFTHTLHEDSLETELKNGTILSNTKYWLCNYFNLASDISLDKDSSGVLYKINLSLPNSDAKVSINNVGFGISQLLPIIVQSMSLNKESILILEQPEIHLHPTVQAKLFDFLVSLNKKGITTFVETHSDHLVTRMRRRVAESEVGLENHVNLVFVEYDHEKSHTKYTKMPLDSLGNFNIWPEGFFDQYDQDVRAILKAQISKKKDIREKSKKAVQD